MSSRNMISFNRTSATQANNNVQENRVPVHISVLRYLELVGVATLLWIMGYNEVHQAWLHVGVYFYVSVERSLTQHRFSLSISQAMADDPPGQLDLILKPAAEPNKSDQSWINVLISKMWSSTSKSIENLIKDMEPDITHNFSQLNNFRFGRICVDGKPPRVQDVQIQPHNIATSTLEFDLKLEYHTECDIGFRYKDMDSTITEFRISGPLRLFVKAGDDGWPSVSIVEVSFLERPDFDFVVATSDCVCTGGKVLLNKEAIRRAVLLEINNLMVEPSQFTIFKAERGEVKTGSTYAQPHGIVRVTIEDVRNLPQSIGRRESNSFIITKVGSKAQKTKLDANCSVDPAWKQSFDFMVDSVEGQVVSLHVLDYFLNKVEKLGRADVLINDVIRTGAMDNWVSLQEVESGEVRLKCQWFWLSNSPIDLYLIETDASKQNQNKAVLVIYLDSVENLPNLVFGKPATPKMMFKLGNQQEFSSVLSSGSSEGRFKCKQAFRFMVGDPHNQELGMKLLSDGSGSHVMGQGVLSVGEVLKSDKMDMERKFKLQQVGGDQKPSVHLFMRLSVRILSSKKSTEIM